ncbi:DUF3052 domain-containing protein [Chondrinema litorale]|uniref:DUF3052 domain-containing protein n=1 Tax=Chondrinema litorale TaxID=2994555 RepID=UPI0025429FCB|nr:DUF3052 domain-containing protein [Chondrinema litorale]UZR97287.1 DUF3052 domain-containing protein [Chondrinema litorale]
MSNTRSGYSGKPLYQKLGIKDTFNCLFISAPENYIDLLECPFVPLSNKAPFDFIHVFAKERKLLEQHIQANLKLLKQDGMIWISWPKKASKVQTDITEDVIREVILPTGLVDIKVCSVNEIWSGLKVVIRKENRT